MRVLRAGVVRLASATAQDGRSEHERRPVRARTRDRKAQLRGSPVACPSRIAALILVVLYLFFVNPALARSRACSACCSGSPRSCSCSAMRPSRPRRTSTIEILGMFAFLTAVRALAGGVSTPLINLYLLPIVTAALALSKRATALVVVLVCVCYPLLQVLTEASNG